MEVILVELSNLMLVAVRNMFSEYNSTIRWFNASDTVRTRWSQVTQEEAEIPNQYQSARSIFLSKINWPVFIKWHKITFHSAAVWLGGWRSGVKVNRMSEIVNKHHLDYSSLPYQWQGNLLRLSDESMKTFNSTSIGGWGLGSGMKPESA